MSGTHWQLNRIAVIGAGAMGTGLAAILGESAPVVVVCRKADRAAQLIRDGAQMTGVLERQSRPLVFRRAEDLLMIGQVNLIFIATKTGAIPSVAADLRPVLERLGDEVFVVSYQNGIDPGRQLIELLGRPQVLRMVLNIGATMDAEGVVRLSLHAPPHFIGALDEYADVCGAVAETLTRAGFETRFTPQIEREVWAKAIINSAMNPVAALVNASVGQTLEAPARVIVERLLLESVAVARAEGLDFRDDYLAGAWRMLQAAGNHTPSMVEDIRAGRESEIGQLNAQVIADGRRLGVPTPTHEVIDALIETFDWRVYGRGGPRPAPARSGERAGGPDASPT